MDTCRFCSFIRMLCRSVPVDLGLLESLPHLCIRMMDTRLLQSMASAPSWRCSSASSKAFFVLVATPCRRPHTGVVLLDPPPVDAALVKSWVAVFVEEKMPAYAAAQCLSNNLCFFLVRETRQRKYYKAAQGLSNTWVSIFAEKTPAVTVQSSAGLVKSQVVILVTKVSAANSSGAKRLVRRQPAGQPF